MSNIAQYNTVQQCGPLSHLLVCLEDVLCGDGAYSCAQRLDHSICHLRAHIGGIGVQNTEVALVTLHHQLQRAPLGVHAADVYCTLLTPPASTCRHTNPEVNLIWETCDQAAQLISSTNTAVSSHRTRFFLIIDFISTPIKGPPSSVSTLTC